MEKSKIYRSIQHIIEEINQNPFLYRNEADIQARLYYQICHDLNEWKPLHKTGFHGLKTNIVHREYFGRQNRSIDLVVFDVNDLSNISMNSMEKKISGNYVKVKDAIEIKTEQGSSGKNRKNNITNDIIKLITLRKNKLADRLHFIYLLRWPTKNKEKQKEILSIVKYAESECKKHKIFFYTNNKDNYFLNQ